MLTSLTVENWKSLVSANLNIDPLTVIIGTNSSGKSNLLDALSFLTRVSNGTMLTSSLQGDGVVSPLRGGLEWAARKPGSRFAISITFRASDVTDYAYRIECEINKNICQLTSEKLERIKYRLNKKNKRGSESGRIQLFWTDSTGHESPTIVARLYNSTRGTPRQLSRANAIIFQLLGQKMPVEVQEGVETLISAIRTIFILDPIPSHMRDFSPLSDRLNSDAGNIAGVLAALPDGQKEAIERTLQNTYLNYLSVISIKYTQKPLESLIRMQCFIAKKTSDQTNQRILLMREECQMVP